jgi:integrase
MAKFGSSSVAYRRNGRAAASPFSLCVLTPKLYRVGLRAIKGYKPLADSPLREITSETLADFAAHRQIGGLQVSTINSSLRVVRRVLRLAVEWGAAESSPKVKLLPGERHRERVVAQEEEAKYLSVAPEPVASIAAVLCDTGLRPEECFRLRWEAITWANGRHGTLLVTHGKTGAARRVLPMTPRVRGILETRWEASGKPVEGWVWAAPTRSGHVESSSLKKQHARAFETLKEEAAKNNERAIRPFVLYSLRHTFLTRLGESGCDAWTLARIAGHSSVSMSSRYVHPSEEAVLTAMARLGGHKIGHSDNQADSNAVALRRLTQ